MVWLVPAALSGLALVAVPLIVHLLARRQARRLPFPSVRFVRPSQAAAVRLRAPQDVPLLLVRMAIIAAAVLATAQPLLLTRGRLENWNSRVARAIVIDASESMRRTDAAGEVPMALASQVAAGEASHAFHAARVESANLPDALLRAVRLLDDAPPARREVVVISDFQAGALSEAYLADVPPDIGLRFLRVGRPPERIALSGGAIAGWRGGTWSPSVQIDQRSTEVTWQRARDTSALGITLITAPADEKAGATALAAAASFGAPLQADRPVGVAFRGSRGIATDADDVHTPWIVNTVLALRRSEARGSVARVKEQQGTLLVESSAAVESVAAAALLRAILVARAVPIVEREAEVNTARDEALTHWRRDPPPVDASAWPRAERTDARWLWVAALLLLGLETWMRRDRAAAEERSQRASAA